MRNDLTDVTLVIDRSGSMSSCAAEASSGINEFIRKQRDAVGECNCTLYHFDSEIELVHRTQPIGNMEPYTLRPRSMTALYDALGKAITETGDRLRSMKEAARPGLVVFLVVTDGAENASQNFTAGQIKAMIEEQQSKYSWVFNFLGAGKEAYEESAKVGIYATNASPFDVKNIQAAYDVTACKLASARAFAFSGEPDAAADVMTYSAVDRVALNE